MDAHLSAVDAAWLRMDRPTNRMMITGVMIFDQRIDPEALGRLLEERLLPHERFRERVVEGFHGPRWQLDPDFDLRSHVHHVALPAPAGHAALVELVSDLLSSPLDRERPLWQLHVVDLDHGGSAVVTRLHHCIGDGVALVRLLLSLTDGEHGAGPRRVGRALPHVHGLVRRARQAALEARALVRLLTLPPDPRTGLAGRLGVRKRVAWSAPLPFEHLERLAHAAGATLNDLVLAAVTGALREWLDEHGGCPPGLEVRALVPVNLRAGDRGGLGNRFGLVYLPLPLGEREPRARLVELKRRADAVKASPDAVVAFGVLGVLGVASAAMERVGVELFTRKATLLATSVPGPPAPVRLAGRRVRELVVFAPASGKMGVTLSLLSYAGQVTIGVASDEHLVPDPGALVTAVERELAGTGFC